MGGNKIAEQLVENIRRICREKNVSIMEMEHDLGFSAGLISRWSKTKTCPSFDKVIDIMDYLDISLDEIMPNAGFSNGKRQKSSANNESKDREMIAQLEKRSISGEIKWEKGREGMPFELDAELVFPNMLDYDIHRVYYAEWGVGWYLLSVQYSEDTAEMLTEVFIVAGSGIYIEKLDFLEESTARLLKAIDEETFNHMSKAQVKKMKEDFMEQEFQSKYRSVS